MYFKRSTSFPDVYMKNRSFRLLIVAFCTILSQWACQSTRDVLVEPIAQDISIDEAKAWLTTQQAAARIKGNKRQSGRNEHWDIARKQNSANGRSIVVVPLTYNFSQLLAVPKSDNDKVDAIDAANQAIQSKLLVYKNDQGAVQAELIHIIPTQESRKKSKKVKGSLFSGFVFSFNQTGDRPLTGLKYRDGKVVGKAKPAATRNGRLNQQRCGFYIYYPADMAPDGVYHELLVKYGTLYAAVFYAVPCAEVSVGDEPSGYGETSSNDGWGWGWSSDFDPYGGGGSGGGGGGGGASGDVGVGGGGNEDYPSGVLDEEGFYSTNPVDLFLHFMQTVRQPSIGFTYEEQTLIREYPELIASLGSYIGQYGEKPDGNSAFRLDAAYQQQYPRFTEVVKSLPTFVEQHERVKNVLVNHTHLPWSKIKTLLKFGSGPKIIIQELNGIYGHTVYPAYPEGFIEINAAFVRGLEAANLNSTKEATTFLLAVTLLHELTHYGAVDGGRNETRVNEFGDEFEREVLGTLISKNNAGQLLITFKKLD